MRARKYPAGTPVLLLDYNLQDPTRINLDQCSPWRVEIVEDAEYRAGTWGYTFKNNVLGNHEEAAMISLEEINALFAAWRQTGGRVTARRAILSTTGIAAETAEGDE